MGAHNIDQVWGITKGSSSTNIAIHSAMGFSVNHEDMSGTRYLSPMTTDAYDPAKGFAQEVAGVIGARTNNGTGMAGINWYSKLKSYNYIKFDEPGDDPDYVFDADSTDYTFDLQRINNMVDQAHNDNMDVQVFTFGVPTSSQSINANLISSNPSLTNYRTLTSGPSFPTPTKAYWSAFQSRLSVIGSIIWSGITSGNNYTVPSDFHLFRSKLYDAAVQDNSLLISAVGDKKDGDSPVPTLVPFAFDDYVVGVGGAEVSQTTGQRSYWSGGGTSSYMDIVAAAKDITTLSGDSYTSYNNSFSSTHGGSAIVGGVVSLLKTQNTNISYDDIEHILENTAVDIEGAGKDDLTGYGFLDAQAALNYITTNDIVRQRVQKSEMNTQSNSVGSTEYIMSPDYDVYKHPGWSTTTYDIRGKLGTYVGIVKFDYIFSSPPDVWLRNSSSGTEVNLAPFPPNHSKQYYDEFGSKSIKVLSIDKYGFTFEMNYWMAEFSNAYRTVGTVQIPYMGNIHIDYTAVGDETNVLNIPPVAPTNFSLTNPGGSFPNFTWTASADADSYKIYRSCNHGYFGDCTAAPQQVGFSSGTSWTDYTVIQNETGQEESYLYSVRGFNLAGGSYYSNSAEVGGQPSYSKIANKKLPTEFKVENNYPNPFNPSTQIKFELPETAEVSLKVYNIMGQEVATIVNSQMQAGFHATTFKADNLSSGVYIARLTARGSSGEQFTQEIKMQLIK